MATKISSIYTLITADDKPLKRGLVKARGEAVKGAKRIQTALNKINFKAIGIGAVAMGTSLAFASKKFIDLAVEQERVEKRLGAVLKSTGNAAGYTLDQMKAMASAMQAVTTTGDETILSGMAILATFKQIRNEAFDRTAMAALDLAEVMQQDLRSSVVQLGKALNDPVANLGALSRAGIQFTKDQKAVIKGLWQAGRAAEAQSLILDEIESQFGGAAKAARDTFGGALKSLGNTLGDTGEKIGFALMKPLKGVIIDFEKWLSLNDKLINQDIPGYIGKTATKLVDLSLTTGKLISMYNKLPAGTLGVIGLLLFGKWQPAKIAGAVVVINEAMKSFSMDIGSIIKDYTELNDVMNRIINSFKVYDKPILIEKKVPSGQDKYSRTKDRMRVEKAFQAEIIKMDEIAMIAAKKHAEEISKLNKQYILTLPEMGRIIENGKAYRDVWEVSKIRTATEEQIKAAEAIKNARTEVEAYIATLTDMQIYKDPWQVKDERTATEEQLAMVEKTEESFNAMTEMSERTAWAMQENFSNVFYDAMTGELNTFKDYFKAIIDSMARAWSDIMGQMATEWIFGQGAKGGGIWSDVVGFASGLFGGGGSSGSSGMGASTIRGGAGGGYGFDSGGHIGETVRGFGQSGKSYEFHPNETVIPDSQLGGGGDTYNVYNINALDAESGMQYLRRIGAVPLLASENLAENGMLRSAIMENV